MTPAMEFRKECSDVSKALVNWLESQEIDTKKAIGAMAMTMAAMIADGARTDASQIRKNGAIALLLLDSEIETMYGIINGD